MTPADRIALLLERIHAERKSRGWSQRELCRRAGIGSGFFSPSQQQNPTLATFFALADALGVEPYTLLAPVQKAKRITSGCVTTNQRGVLINATPTIYSVPEGPPDELREYLLSLGLRVASLEDTVQRLEAES